MSQAFAERLCGQPAPPPPPPAPAGSGSSPLSAANADRERLSTAPALAALDTLALAVAAANRAEAEGHERESSPSLSQAGPGEGSSHGPSLAGLPPPFAAPAPATHLAPLQASASFNHPEFLLEEAGATPLSDGTGRTWWLSNRVAKGESERLTVATLKQLRQQHSHRERLALLLLDDEEGY